MTQQRVSLEVGSKQWEQMRRRCLTPIPGRFSALYYFNDIVLGHGELVPMTPRAHYAMCLFLENATGIPAIDEARVKMCLVPRGLGKSTIGTKGASLQKLIKYDDYSIGIANEKQDLANGFLGQIKTEFETNELLRALFPERIPEDFRKTTWAVDRIIIPRKKPNPTSPSVLATGVGGTVTGVHMNEWVIDDIISQNAAENAYRGSFSEIEATNRWITRIQPLLKSPKRDPITIIGTRWWEGDTYEFIEDFFGHGEPKETYTWTLKLPDGETQTIKLYRVGEIAVFARPAIENGRSIFPERYTLEDLQQMQQEDPVFFAGQYLLAPAAGAASEFKPDWLKDYAWSGSQIEYRDQSGKLKYISPTSLLTFMSVDPAISDSHSAARSAVPVVGTNGTEIFLLDDYAEKGLGMFNLAHQVVDKYIRWKPQRIFVETIVYQRALLEALKQVSRERGVPELMGAISEIKSHGGKSKDFRIYGLEPFFKAGRFYKHRSHTNFITEYSTFPRGALRDVIDALSFQKDAWERAALSLAPAAQGLQGAMAQHHKDAMDRIRRAWGRR